MVVYKAAITGKRIVCPLFSLSPVLPLLLSLFVHFRHLRQGLRLIKQLIYSPPPLFPLSAFGWCIAALSLPPSGVDRHMSDWLGQVGLMDITALHARKEGWIASTFPLLFPLFSSLLFPAPLFPGIDSAGSYFCLSPFLRTTG